MKASLNQVSELARFLKNDEILKEHFPRIIWYDIVAGISEKQYKYILYLLYNNKRMKLRNLLNDLIKN